MRAAPRAFDQARHFRARVLDFLQDAKEHRLDLRCSGFALPQRNEPGEGGIGDVRLLAFQRRADRVHRVEYLATAFRVRQVAKLVGRDRGQVAKCDQV